MSYVEVKVVNIFYGCYNLHWCVEC